jgi:hypothetical protein
VIALIWLAAAGVRMGVVSIYVTLLTNVQVFLSAHRQKTHETCSKGTKARLGLGAQLML